MVEFYRMAEVSPKSGIPRYVHLEVLGTRCYPAVIEAGNRGYIKYFHPIDRDWYMLHTSTIESVTTDDDGVITIVTRNTKYVLKPEEET